MDSIVRHRINSKDMSGLRGEPHDMAQIRHAAQPDFGMTHTLVEGRIDDRGSKEMTIPIPLSDGYATPFINSREPTHHHVAID